MKNFHVHLSETDKQFLVALVYAAGIILFWRGIWEVVDVIPILKNPFVSFFIGLLILTLTGFIYREFDPFAQKINKLQKTIHNIISHAKKEEKYLIHYFDQITRKHHIVKPEEIRRVEHHHLVLARKGKEFFVPLDRVSRIHKDKEVVWRK